MPSEISDRQRPGAPHGQQRQPRSPISGPAPSRPKRVNRTLSSIHRRPVPFGVTARLTSRPAVRAADVVPVEVR